MAVTIIPQSDAAYVGLSSDTKPTAAKQGTKFYETNTGLWFIYNGSAWVAFTGDGGGGAERLKRVRATTNSVSPGVIAAAGDYTALDVLNHSTSAGLAWIAPSIARAAGTGGTIVQVRATLSVAAVVVRLRLHMFNAVPTVLQNDNVALVLDLDDRAAYLGVIDLEALHTSGSSEYAWAEAREPFPFQTNADANLYFVVQTLDSFTNETAGMTLDIALTAEQD